MTAGLKAPLLEKKDLEKGKGEEREFGIPDEADDGGSDGHQRHVPHREGEDTEVRQQCRRRVGPSRGEADSHEDRGTGMARRGGRVRMGLAGTPGAPHGWQPQLCRGNMPFLWRQRTLCQRVSQEKQRKGQRK